MPENRVFLITGASSGIGAATARAAAAAGFRLVLAARSSECLSSLAAELGGSERALAVRCDVTERDQQEAMAQRSKRSDGSMWHSATLDSALRGDFSMRARSTGTSRWC